MMKEIDGVMLIHFMGQTYHFHIKAIEVSWSDQATLYSEAFALSYEETIQSVGYEFRLTT